MYTGYFYSGTEGQNSSTFGFNLSFDFHRKTWVCASDLLQIITDVAQCQLVARRCHRASDSQSSLQPDFLYDKCFSNTPVQAFQTSSRSLLRPDNILCILTEIPQYRHSHSPLHSPKCYPHCCPLAHFERGKAAVNVKQSLITLSPLICGIFLFFYHQKLTSYCHQAWQVAKSAFTSP